MLQTPLHPLHRQLNGRLVDFAGWEMPLVYTGIIEEHHYTRQHVSCFDVSHMGRVLFRGGGAGEFLEKLCTRRLGDASVGQCRYSHVCRADGGILDDVIVSRYEDHWLMVCNASNREKLLGWFEQQRRAFEPQPASGVEKQRPGQDVQIDDITTDTVMVALQGPEALPLLDRLLPFKVSELKRYHFKHGSVLGASYTIARSGYTGEDGAEAILPARFAIEAARILLENSKDLGMPVKPAGLGARDTLRLEAGMPLYGHELTEEWDSLTAGQAWCVDLSKDFIGAAAMRRIKEAGLTRQLVGFELGGKRIARQGAGVFAGASSGGGAHSGSASSGRSVGVVTSGTQSPTLDKVIGMALVESSAAAVGTTIEIDLRGARAAGKVVPLPFYKRAK